MARTSPIAANVHHVGSTSNSTTPASRRIAADGDPDADEDEEPGLGQRGEVLGLGVPVRVTAIRGTHRDRDGEEGEQGGGEIGAGVRSLGKQAETRARQPDDELDRDEETGGPDRDERGPPLRRHARKARWWMP